METLAEFEKRTGMQPGKTTVTLLEAAEGDRRFPPQNIPELAAWLLGLMSAVPAASRDSLAVSFTPCYSYSQNHVLCTVSYSVAEPESAYQKRLTSAWEHCVSPAARMEAEERRQLAALKAKYETN